MTAPAKWHEGPMIAIDTETTGINPLEDRIVTAAVVHAHPGQRPRSIQWLVHPDTDIPEEAAAVHGWTLDRLEAKLAGHKAMRILNGQERYIPKDAALFEIAAQAGVAMGNDVPLVVCNAAYDLTLLETELERAGCPTLASRPTGITGIVDPQVIEKQWDPYRKLCYKAAGCKPAEQHHECSGCRGGKHRCGGCGAHNKQLDSLCHHYGIVHTGAHDANGDALAAIRLARRLGGVWPEIARWKLPTLHGHQVTWRRDQANSLRAYFDKNGFEHDGVDPGWPVQTTAVKAVA